MHFGLQLPYLVPAGRDDLLDFARRADAGPFRTVNIGERIAYDNADQLVALAAAAAVTAATGLALTLAPAHAP